MSFSSLVVGLAHSALSNLGEGPGADGTSAKVNLDLARHNIDLLGVLHTKTKGNLDEDEQKLLEGLLYETRTKFVAKRNET